jgi:predicted transcriptional regulator
MFIAKVVPMSERHTFFMMIQGRWWKEFLRRNEEGKETHAYVLRGAAPPKTTVRILFYVTKPVAEVAGYAEFIERKVEAPEVLWKTNGEESVLNSEQYDEIVRGADKMSFVRFRNLHKAAKPVPLNDVLMFFSARRLPRRGFYVDKDRGDKLVAMMS